MSPTLQSLWDECQEDRLPLPSPEVREKIIAYYDQITKTFGIQFTDGLTNAISTEQTEEIKNAYELGFHTAFRLWMEVLAG